MNVFRKYISVKFWSASIIFCLLVLQKDLRKPIKTICCGGGGAINNAHLKDLITQSARAFSLHHNPSAIQKITVKTWSKNISDLFLFVLSKYLRSDYVRWNIWSRADFILPYARGDLVKMLEFTFKKESSIGSLPCWGHEDECAVRCEASWGEGREEREHSQAVVESQAVRWVSEEPAATSEVRSWGTVAAQA